MKKLPIKLKIYFLLKSFYHNLFREIILKKWINEGKPLPPPHLFKQEVIRNYQRNFSLNILVETGTYYGDMIYSQRKIFREIYSIELSKYFFELAKVRFKGYDYIKLFNGDSKEKLQEIVLILKEAALFWLDAHWSGGITAKLDESETPVLGELKSISGFSFCNKSVILIDDARCFNGSNGYPTINELVNICREYFPLHNLKVENDIIQIFPNNNYD